MRTSMFAFAFCGAAALALAQNPCEKLKSLQTADAMFTTVEMVPAGPVPAPAGGGTAAAAAPAAGRGAAGGGRGAAAPAMLPAYCRVAATLKPSFDSDIKMELYLPVEGWNGKFEMMGNGGWAGSIQGIGQMQAALREGYAASATDTGHEGGNGMFALDHPEKITDFAYRAVHETAVKSKMLITAYYGKAPKYSYWNGCSTGGRQALVEVTKFPDDFDGVIAGAPANPHIHLHAAGVERSIELAKNNAPLTQAKVESLHRAILGQCDALDGVKDGLIGDPHKCKFDPASLLCKGADSDACLTAGQVETVKIAFGDVKTRKGEVIWTGYEPGSELQVTSLRTVPTPTGGGWDSIRILGHQDASYDWHKFDLDADVALADKAGIDALTSDLSKFKQHGGKLLLYHGWADPAIPPGHTVLYYESVLATMGKKQDGKKQEDQKQEAWMRLFMVPGMQHCSGGSGTDQFNKMAVLERWREGGEAPAQIVASHVTGGQVDMTRPLCPYPQVAVYKGAGSTNAAASFSCKAQ
jgi:feruloyl esterase